MAYPPGIPIIYPGERLTREIIDFIKALKEDGLDVQGMDDPDLEDIKIIEEEDAMHIYVEKMRNRILGVPLNLGADRGGIEFGLDVLLEEYADTFAEIDIIEVNKQPEDFRQPKLKYKNTILDTCNRLAEKVYYNIQEGYRPVVIGGDHSISLGSISGVSKAKGRDNIGVIWIDAHGDMNTEKTTITGNIHGMPLAFLQGYGDSDMVNCYFDGAKIKSENVVLFGARDLDPLEAQFIK
jgi:ornithine decarboxylase